MLAIGAVSFALLCGCSEVADLATSESATSLLPVASNALDDGVDNTEPTIEFVAESEAVLPALRATCVLTSVLEYALIDLDGLVLLDFGGTSSIEQAVGDLVQSYGSTTGLSRIEQWRVFNQTASVDDAELAYSSEHIAIGYKNGGSAPEARLIVRGNQSGYGVVALQACSGTE